MFLIFRVEYKSSHKAVVYYCLKSKISVIEYYKNENKIALIVSTDRRSAYKH